MSTQTARVLLGRMASLITKGTTPKTMGAGYVGSGVPFMRAENIRGLTVRWREDALFITESTHAALSRSQISPGDVLISIAGTIGRVGVVPDDAPPLNCNQAVAIVRPASGIDRRYLAHWLAGDDAQRQIGTAKVSATIANLSLGEIGKLRVPVPPLSEQRRIADILDRADAIRRKRREAIALTEELLRSAFLEMFGDPVGNPRGWPIAPLSDLAEVRSGVAKGKKYGEEPLTTVPYMRVANVQDGHIDLTDVRTIDVSAGEFARYALQAGDVLLTEGGDPDKLGRGAVWDGAVTPCIHQNHVFCVRTGSQLRPEFLGALLSSSYGKRYFLRAAKQTTGIATINATQLRAFPVLCPPAALQDRHGRLLDGARAAAASLGEASVAMGTLAVSLTNQFFGGGAS